MATPDLTLVEAVLLRVARDEGYDVRDVPDAVTAALEDWLSEADRLHRMAPAEQPAAGGEAK